MERSRSKTDVIREIQRQFKDLQSQVTVLVNRGLSTDWLEIGTAGVPAFQNSWVNYGVGYAGAAFKKDATGIVRLRGLVKNGSGTNTIFTLPVGFRPSEGLLYGIDAGGAHGRIDVDADGDVRLAIGGTSYVQLNGITFPAEQ